MSGYLFETIAAQLENDINRGVLAEGSKLPSERNLAESYGVSRNVVREAIRMLSEKGFIEVRAGRGAYVCKPNQKNLSDCLTVVVENSSASLEEIVEAREVFELSVLPWAIQRTTEEDIEKLRDLYEQMQQSRKKSKEYARLDMEFHMALVRCAKNQVLTLLAGSVYNMAQSNLFLMTTLNPERIESAQREHKEMIDGLALRDENRVRGALHDHIQCIREQIQTNRN